jgi:hypothetical protein
VFTRMIEAVFPLWRYVPRIVRHFIGFLAVLPILWMQNWMELHHMEGPALIVAALDCYLALWSLGILGVFLRVRRVTKRVIRRPARPLSRKWFMRHYLLGTFDRREDHE